MRDENCIFCKIIAGEIPSYKIYEDEHSFAFLDIAKDFEGHTLVIPKKHYENLFDCPKEELEYVIKAVQKIANHYKVKGYDGINILNANGKSAEQSVSHLHFHIIPRKNNDGLHIYPNYVVDDNMNLDEILKKLKL